jgi:hypothetical protein
LQLVLLIEELAQLGEEGDHAIHGEIHGWLDLACSIEMS